MTRATKPIISVVCPCYNEAQVIEVFYRELTWVLDKEEGYDFEILFVDDGSNDSTLCIVNDIAAEDSRVKVFSFSKNFGHQAALLAGINGVSQRSEAIVILDSDLQHPPKYIPDMLTAWSRGNEIVSMVRQGRTNNSFLKILSSKLYYKLINSVSEVTIVSDCADFSLIDRKVFEVIQSMHERDLFLRGAISWVGFNRTFIKYHEAERRSGDSKYTAKKMIDMAIHSLFSFSSKPIQVCFKIGLAFLMLAISYLFYAVGMFFFIGTEPGWTSIVAIVVFFGGANLLTLGLLGEYISRIYDEVKGRPRYIFKQRPDGVGQKRNFAIGEGARARKNVLSSRNNIGLNVEP